ncbi:unnamed protein product [Urochloa humidicola]
MPPTRPNNSFSKLYRSASELASTPHRAAGFFYIPLLRSPPDGRQVGKGNRRLSFSSSFSRPSSSTKEPPLHSTSGSGFIPIEKEKMGGFDKQVKERTKELKHLKAAAMRGIKAAGESCKKAWSKVRSSIKR